MFDYENQRLVRPLTVKKDMYEDLHGMSWGPIKHQLQVAMPKALVDTGRLRPEVQPFTLLYTIFYEKDTSFVNLLFTNINGSSFTYLV